MWLCFSGYFFLFSFYSLPTPAGPPHVLSVSHAPASTLLNVAYPNQCDPWHDAIHDHGDEKNIFSMVTVDEDQN
jgi:hypothetical protein